MSLRLRLIVVFFLLSVVPVGAVTWYTYATNAQAMRDAAGAEAELLAAELSGRMATMTAQLSQRVEQLMELPEPPRTGSGASAAASPATAAPTAGRTAATTRTARQAQRRADEAMAGAAAAQAAAERVAAEAARLAASTVPPIPPVSPVAPALIVVKGTGADGQPTAADLHKALGDLGELLNNIEVRGLRPRRLGPPPDGRAAPGGTTGVPPGAPPGTLASPGDRSARFERGGFGGRGGPNGPGGGPEGRPGSAFPGARVEDPADPSKIRVDLREIRRKLFDELAGDRSAFEKLPPEERQKIFAQIEQRMGDVAQGVEALQKALAARALEGKTADAAAAATIAAATSTPPAMPSPSTPAQSADATPPPPPPPAAPGAPQAAAAKPAATPKPRPAPRPAAAPKPTPAPSAPATPAGAAAPEAATPPAPPMKRSTSLSGGKLAVKVERGGEVVGQVNADVDLPKLLGTVFAVTSRERGELPFAIGEKGELYTANPADRTRLETLGPQKIAAAGKMGTTVLPDWIVATTPDPTGSHLTFGIARPVGESLQDLRASSARNAALGLGFIGLALIAIVPLSGRLTRNLDTLSAGVRRIAEGDYSTRVAVNSGDEVGRLAKAFNQMAADVEAHQRSAISQERIRRELELGRQIQHDMLPREALHLGLTEIKGVSVPAREVGGDFFNYFSLRDGTIALLVGDVSGKGVGAALLMANLQAALRTRLSLGQDLASLARELDVDIDRTTPGPVYSTLFVGILDPAGHRLRFVNAGHNPQYVLRPTGRLERMESTGRPIGLLSGGGYIEHDVTVTAGDVLFFYTDGCVEAENADGDMFGAERLEAALAAAAGQGADQVMVAVESQITRFRSGVELTDDATMMVVKVG